MYQARGGSPEEFLQALYAVSRELQVGAGGSMLAPSARGSQSGSSHGSSPNGSHNSSQSSFSPTHKRGLWALASLAPWRGNKDDDSDASGICISIDYYYILMLKPLKKSTIPITMLRL